MTQTYHPTVLRHLRRCIAASDITAGRILHALSLKISFFPNSTLISNHLLLLYAKSPTLTIATRLFDEISHPNVFTYNTLLSAYTRHSLAAHLAYRFFLQIPNPDIVSYNTLLSAYATRGAAAECIELFSQVRHSGLDVDNFTVSSLLSVLNFEVRQVHTLAVSAGFDLFVSVDNAMIGSYSRSGLLDDARKVFDEMGSALRDVVSWNCMIMAYGKHREGIKALGVFRKMVRMGYEVDVFTLGSVLTAFTTVEDLNGGMQFHCQLIKTARQKNSHVGSGLVDLYSKSGRISDAKKVFDEVTNPDLVLWNAMIHGYSHGNEFSEDALVCFRNMRRAAICPDHRTLVSVISACSDLASPAQGKQIHSLALRMDSHGDQVTVSNALIAMYSKFGNLEDARQVFERMVERDTVSFNSMIGGYAQHGHGAEALALFKRMLNSSTLKPTSVTFVSVLSACAHTGRVEEGQEYFTLMEQAYGIRPRDEHYTCMIDLFGRAAAFGRAENFIEAMPFDPGTYGWTALLSSCRVHGNFELGVKAALRLLELEPSNAAAYVTLSNVYARLGRWDEAEKVRKLMRSRGLKKESGLSWTQDEEENTFMPKNGKMEKRFRRVRS